MSRKRRSSSRTDDRPRRIRDGAPERGSTRASARAPLWLGAGLLVLLVGMAAVVFGTGPRQPTGGSSPATPSSVAATAAVTGASTPQPSGTATVGPALTPLPPIDGVACDPTEQATYHAHAHLNVRVNGQLKAIPGDVGLRSTCLYWLHTHQVHGVIHVEAPSQHAFTLGQFFAVWGKPLDATVVADSAVPEGSRLWAFVNGEPYDGDPRLVALEDLVSIELQIGPAALDPLPYTFPAELL